MKIYVCLKTRGLTYTWKEENRDNNWNKNKQKKISISLSGTWGLVMCSKGLGVIFHQEKAKA